MINNDQGHQIVAVYCARQNNEQSRMLNYRTFGYRRIKVLRPLRMALHITIKGLKNLKQENAWAKLAAKQQASWEATLIPYLDTKQPLSWAGFFTTETAKGIPVLCKNHKSFIKALMNGFGKRDPEMDPVVDAEGHIVPDPDLTDYQNIPLTEDIRDYFEREILPYVPEAYIDETFRDDKDNQIGYEINFNRYFYRYKSPRLLEAIDADLQQIEAAIAALFREVTE
jgi:type I restriction enzyme M protein